jgi:hypothetical protein
MKLLIAFLLNGARMGVGRVHMAERWMQSEHKRSSAK